MHSKNKKKFWLVLLSSAQLPRTMFSTGLKGSGYGLCKPVPVPVSPPLSSVTSSHFPSCSVSCVTCVGVAFGAYTWLMNQGKTLPRLSCYKNSELKFSSQVSVLPETEIKHISELAGRIFRLVSSPHVIPSSTNTDFPSLKIKWVLTSVLPNIKISCKELECQVCVPKVLKKFGSNPTL